MKDLHPLMSEEKVIVLLLDLLGTNLGGSLVLSQTGQLLLDKRGRNVSALVSKLRGSGARDFFDQNVLHRSAETEGRRVNLESNRSCVKSFGLFKGGSIHGV